jgi:hypothetical protein
MIRGPHSPAATCPGSDRLLDLVEGRLEPALRRSLTAHARGCGRCGEEIAAWKTLLGALRAEALDAPPAHLSDWARRLPATLAPTPPRRRSLLRLVADSWGDLKAAVGSAFSAPLVPAVAVRSGGILPRRLGRRRLLFATGTFDLDIQIDYSGETDPRRVRGQILPAEGPRRLWLGSEVRLATPRRAVARARIDRRGEFVMPRVQPGRYRIEVQGPTRCASVAVEV